MATKTTKTKTVATQTVAAKTIGQHLDTQLDAFKASVAKPVGQSRVKQVGIAATLLGAGAALGVAFG